MSLSLLLKKYLVFPYSRKPWIMLLAGSLLPFSLALVFQHYLGMPPCVLCIYQRVALLGIALSALLALLSPTCHFLRVLALVLWGFSAFKRLLVAWEQTQRYLNPSQFAACAFRVRFPEWMSLDNWLPQVFKAYAACESSDWSLLGLSIPQWMVFMFATHLMVVGVATCIQVVTYTNFDINAKPMGKTCSSGGVTARGSSI